MMHHPPQLPPNTPHETDLPLGGFVFHGLETVKIFGRERDNKTGIVETYLVINSQGRRYQVAANKLRG